MKLFALLLLVILSNFVYSQDVKLRNIITHNRKTITTDPSAGIKNYPVWSVFPSNDLSVRRIKMYVTLGCPDSLPCAHWDYLDHITLVKKGGKNGKELNYELGRMLTPYGSIYSQGWDFTWWADVTDFAMLLRDSVLINYAHSGYEPASVGWALTLRFEILEGPQVVKPISVTPLWNGSYRYGDPKTDMEKSIAPIGFSIDNNKSFARLRIQHTGHGMDRPKGCSEFCSRWREIILNETVVEKKDLWKDCGSNPLYPQGGTWIFDRALWCPGDLQQPDQYDFFVAPGKHTADIRMEPYTATDNIQANEVIASYLIHYELPKAKQDVAVEEIMVPNNQKAFNRINPAILNPKITIRNLGSENLKTLKIIWQVKGFEKHEFLWSGNLPFNKVTEIQLPGIIESQKGTNQFTVTLSLPNGKKDAWPGDNTMQSVFLSPPEMPEKIIVKYLTNNRPEENTIRIINDLKETVYLKKPEDAKPQTLYTDTLNLIKGKYELELTDTAGNGLEFWYEMRQGFGYLRLLDLQGRLLYNFESDCGNGQFLAFSTNPGFKADSINTKYSFILFPRRVKNDISLDYHSDKLVDMNVLITADGVPVETHWYKNVKQGKLTYTVAHFPAGRYIIDVSMNGISQFKRRFNKE